MYTASDTSIVLPLWLGTNELTSWYFDRPFRFRILTHTVRSSGILDGWQIVILGSEQSFVHPSTHTFCHCYSLVWWECPKSSLLSWDYIGLYCNVRFILKVGELRSHSTVKKENRLICMCFMQATPMLLYCEATNFWSATSTNDEYSATEQHLSDHQK